MTTNPSSQRIVVVDCLRGFALFGLFIVHMVEYFELFWYAPEWGWVHDTIFFMFGGKAYAIFALLFGLSFFIMMDNQARRGVDFRGRFAWRLALLAAMGYVHGVLYSGDILQVLALSGFLLILIYPLRSRWILTLAILCLLQIPSLAVLVALIGGAPPPGDPAFYQLMGDSNAIYATGTFAEVIQRNQFLGQVAKWTFMFESGRIWNVIGLFLIGFVLGRLRFFENYREYLHIAVAGLVVLLVLLATVYLGQALLSEASLPDATRAVANGILDHHRNNLLTAAGVVLFLLAWEVRFLQRPMGWLAPCGRMSLTVYVTQSIYGVPLFYGFGLGLYTGFGQLNALLLGLALWVLQMVIAAAWTRRYFYGPLEWAWRAATYTSLDVPWKRPAGST